jgi:hypothetical protein
MKITLESTTQIVDIVIDGCDTTVKARVWEGTTESGIKVQALITRIAAKATEDLSQFERELQETKPPSPDFQPFPLRMIL